MSGVWGGFVISFSLNLDPRQKSAIQKLLSPYFNAGSGNTQAMVFKDFPFKVLRGNRIFIDFFPFRKVDVILTENSDSLNVRVVLKTFWSVFSIYWVSTLGLYALTFLNPLNVFEVKNLIGVIGTLALGFVFTANPYPGYTYANQKNLESLK